MASLLNRSHYSLGYSSASVPEIVSYAKQTGSKSVALTDTNTLAGVPEFLIECKKQDIHPIVGLTVKAYHNDHYVGDLAFLAKSQSGYKKLVDLLSNSTCENPKVLSSRVQVSDINNLIRNNDILTLDGFAGSIMHRGITKDSLYFAKQARTNYIVVETPNVPSDILSNIDLQNQLCDAGVVHRAVTSSVASFYFDDGSKQDPALIASLYRYEEHCKKTGELDDISTDVVRGFHAINTELFINWCAQKSSKNTGELSLLSDAYLLTLEPPVLKNKKNIPIISGENEEFLIQYLNETLRKYTKYRKFTPEKSLEYTQRLEHEISKIDRCDGGLAYMENNRYLISLARNNDIGMTVRGSAASSLCIFLMQGIINGIDPIEQKLTKTSFRRFFDEERSSVPDVDIDITEPEKFQALIKKKVGSENYIKMRTYRSIKSLSSAFKTAILAIENAGLIKDIMPFKSAQEELDKFIKIKHLGKKTWNELEQHQPFFEFVASDRYRKYVAAIGKRLTGLYSGSTYHGGVILSNKKNDIENLPVIHNKKTNEYVADVFYLYVDDTSEIKYDAILSGKQLKVVVDLEKKVRERKGTILGMNMSDPLNFHALQIGAYKDIFQLQGFVTYNVTEVLKPKNVEDLMACIPIGKDSSYVLRDSYIKGRNNKNGTGSPIMDEILKDTHGVILYDEQIIDLCIDVAGMSFHDGDALRSAYKKKNKIVVSEKLNQFYKGAITNGIDHSELSIIMNFLDKKKDVYTMPRAHAASYTRISLRQLYLKANYPDLYMQAYCKNESDLNIMLTQYASLGYKFSSLDITTDGMYSKTLRDDGVLRVVPGIVDSVSKDFYLAVIKLREYCIHQLDNKPVESLPLMEVFHHLAEYTLLTPLPILTDKLSNSHTITLKNDMTTACKKGAFDKWLPKDMDINITRQELTAAIPELINDIIGLKSKPAEERELSKKLTA